MDIALLKTFVEVARTRHFGKAAERLFVTQSAVSARIRLLEDRLGVVLFDRKRNDIRLTEAGERLLRHADAVLSAWERARREMAMGQEYGQALQIGVQPDLWRLWVGAWAGRMEDAGETVACRFDLAPPAILGERLAAAALDLAFVMEPPQRPGLVQRQVVNVPLVMVARDPTPLAEGIPADYWYVDWGLSFAISHDALFAGSDIARRSANEGDVVLRHLLEHGGVAYLPRQWTDPLVAQGRLVEVEGAPPIERAGFAVWRPESARAKLIERLLQI